MTLARPAIRKAHIEMVPLIDSFFLLLAFFISSVLSLSMIGGLPIELPSVAKTVKLDPKDLVVITVTRDRQLQLDGQAVSLSGMTARLKADPRAASLRIAVRADRLVSAGQLLEVLGAVRGAGVHRVGLIANPTAEPSLP